MNIIGKVTDSIKRFLVRHKRVFLMLFLYFNLFVFASTIMIIIRTRPAGNITVPDVEGRKFSFVYNLIERNSLKPELKFEDVRDVEDGIILSQDPESGKVVPKNTRIILVVSRNELEIDTPSLIGSALSTAKTKLLNLHSGERTVSLLTGVVTYIPSDKPEGIIIDQNPKPGESVSPDRRVNLLVSAGTVSDGKMPDVKGQSIDLAFDLVLSKGCGIEQEIVKTDSIDESGKILDQSVAPGEIVAQGQTVKFKIAYYPLKEHLYDAYEQMEYEVKAGAKSLVEAFVEDDGGKRLCYSSYVDGNAKINFVFARRGNARISILKDKKLVTVLSSKMSQF